MSENYDERINRTLRALGSVEPVRGMEERIAARLARAHVKQATPQFFRLPQFALGMATAAALGAVIVAGSVSHSRHILPIAPGLHLPVAAEPGVGAANAAHVAPQPVTALPQDRPRSVRKTDGRGVISPSTKKPAGIAVPKTLPARD